MNEQRIRELSKQASIHAEETVHYYTGQPDGLTWEAKILKARDLKFAQLIVRECSAFANHFSDGHEKDQFGRKMFLYTNDIGQVILEHFGVEE